MIDVIKKIYYEDPTGRIGSFAEVTVDSIENAAILLGYHHSNSRFVVYREDVDTLIEALKELKTYL